MDLQEMGSEGMKWINMGWGRQKWWAVVKVLMDIRAQ
jgi:hypothetical protein